MACACVVRACAGHVPALCGRRFWSKKILSRYLPLCVRARRTVRVLCGHFLCLVLLLARSGRLCVPFCVPARWLHMRCALGAGTSRENVRREFCVDHQHVQTIFWPGPRGSVPGAQRQRARSPQAACQELTSSVQAAHRQRARSPHAAPRLTKHHCRHARVWTGRSQLVSRLHLARPLMQR